MYSRYQKAYGYNTNWHNNIKIGFYQTYILPYLSPRLRDNLELALLDIYEGSASVPYYLERLKDSDKVEKALIDTDNKWKICYMSDRIRNKYNID